MKPTVKRFIKHRKSLRGNKFGPTRNRMAVALRSLRKQHGTKGLMKRLETFRKKDGR